MMAEYKSRRAVNFDLSTEALKKEFGENNYQRGYKLIQTFLKAHGFTHRQWSGYTSENALSNTKILDITASLFEKHKWLTHCANRFDVTHIGDEYDMLMRMSELPRALLQLQDLTVAGDIQYESDVLEDEALNAGDDDLEL